MAAKYYTILTETGKAKVANAAALGRQIQLSHLAVGDGNGAEYDPIETQTALKKENYRTPISHLGTDAQNPNWVIAEGMIPVDTGGWFVREVGVYDEDGDLFAIGKYPETYKPTLAEGTGRDLYVRFIMVVSNTETINMKIDPTVEIATKTFVKGRTDKSFFIDAGADNTGSDDVTAKFGFVDAYFVPAGKYRSSGDFSSGHYRFSSLAKLVDSSTNLPFKPCHDGELQHLNDAFFDRMARTFTGWTPKIVCFGDSNTRYYEGENGGAGPACKSYGQILSVLCGHYPSTFGANIVVSGHPGNTADWGSDEIANHVDDDADIVVLGFGTNDVKLSTATNEDDLEKYLSSMKSMIKHVLSLDATPIVLGIPWFSETYGHYDALSQKIIKVWNTHLYYLCQWANIPFIDTYNLTRKYGDIYFNETNLKRHYSQAATKAIAERLMVEIINTSQSSQMKAHVFNTFESMPYAKSDLSPLYKRGYTLGHERFETLVIPDGKSLTLDTFGLTCVGFYPRATAKALFNIDGVESTLQITNTTDKNLYYPVFRHVIGKPSQMANDSQVTITASEGDLYIRYMAFESTPFSSTDKVNGGNTPPVYEMISAANLPAEIDYSVIYQVSELTGLPVYNRGGTWFGYDGLYAIGTTSMMDQVLSTGAPNGKKFYNTDEQQAKRLVDGVWTNM